MKVTKQGKKKKNSFKSITFIGSSCPPFLYKGLKLVFVTPAKYFSCLSFMIITNQNEITITFRPDHYTNYNINKITLCFSSLVLSV